MLCHDQYAYVLYDDYEFKFSIDLCLRGERHMVILLG